MTDCRKQMTAGILGLVLVAAVTAPVRAEAPKTRAGALDPVLVTPPGPWDRGVSVEQRRRARALMLEGNRLIKIPLIAQAADKYREGLVLWGHPALHYNLGIALLNLVQPIEAYRSFQQALRHGPAPLGQDKFEQGKKYLAMLDGRLSRISVACDIAGAEVTLDGERLFIGPGEREEIVTPGRHQLVAGKRNHVPDTRQVTLSPGKRVRAVLVPRSMDELARRERRWAVWKSWIPAAAGAGLIVGAGYLDWRSSSGFDDFDRGFEDRCRIRGCDGTDIPALVEQKESAEFQQGIALGLYIAGGVAVAASAALIYLNRERLTERQDLQPAFSITPVITESGGGLSASIRF